MHLLALALAFLAGVALPFQAGANATLGRRLGHPMYASAVSFAVGLATLLVAVAVYLRRAPALDRAGGVPWWAWWGGLIGAAYVLTATSVVTRIGALNLLCWGLAGQLIANLVIDRYGLVGLPTLAVTPKRLVGVALIVAGATFIALEPRRV